MVNQKLSANSPRALVRTIMAAMDAEKQKTLII